MAPPQELVPPALEDLLVEEDLILTMAAQKRLIQYYSKWRWRCQTILSSLAAEQRLCYPLTKPGV